MSSRRSTVLSTQLAGMRRRPGRTLITGLSVLLASFVVFATVLAYQITTATFLDSFSDTSAGTSLVMQTTDGTQFSSARLGRVRATAGVAEVTGRVDGSLEVNGTGDRRLDLVAGPASGPLARWHLVSGAYPSAAGQIAIGRSTAEQWSVDIGSRLLLRRGPAQPGARSTKLAVTVTGLVDSPVTGEGYAPDRVVARLLDSGGYSRIDIRAATGTSAADLQQRLSPLLGTDGTIDLTDGSEVRRSEAKDAVRQFDVVFALIGMFLLVAVIAAGLVATSTFRIVFAQRLRQLALLRTIGARQGQLSRALAAEGALTGLLAGTAGVIAAALLAPAARAGAAATGNSLSGGGFPILAAVLVVVGAVLVTLGSVIAPALSAADVSPLQALRSADTAPARGGTGWMRLLIGVLLALAAAATAVTVIGQLPTRGQEYEALESNLLKIVLSGGLAFAALIALGPVLLRGLLTLLGPPLRRFGLTAELAGADLRRMPGRAAAVSVVVALGVTLLAGTVVGAASVRSYVDSGLAAQVPADFVVVPAEGTLSPGTVRRLNADPDLRHVTAYRQAAVTPVSPVYGSSLAVTDLDLDALPRLKNLAPASGSLTELGKDEVAISDRTAVELKLAVGSTLPLAPGGTVSALRVRAVLSGNGPLGSALIVNAATLDRLRVPITEGGVFADAARGGPDGRRTAAQSIRSIIHRQPDTGLTVLANVNDTANSAVGKMFAAALGLIGLTVLIAVVGVGTTMSLTVMERTREFGLLRALGLDRTGLRTLIGIEAGLYGLIGAGIGLLLGVPYAWLSILALNLNAPLRLPFGQLAIVMVILTTVTVIAGLLPTRRAVRVSPVVALGAGG